MKLAVLSPLASHSLRQAVPLGSIRVDLLESLNTAMMLFLVIDNSPKLQFTVSAKLQVIIAASRRHKVSAKLPRGRVSR